MGAGAAAGEGTAAGAGAGVRGGAGAAEGDAAGDRLGTTGGCDGVPVSSGLPCEAERVPGEGDSDIVGVGEGVEEDADVPVEPSESGPEPSESTVEASAQGGCSVDQATAVPPAASSTASVVQVPTVRRTPISDSWTMLTLGGRTAPTSRYEPSRLAKSETAQTGSNHPDGGVLPVSVRPPAWVRVSEVGGHCRSRSCSTRSPTPCSAAEPLGTDPRAMPHPSARPIFVPAVPRYWPIRASHARRLRRNIRT